MHDFSFLAVNARAAAQALGGQQRVAQEILKRLPGAVQLRPDTAVNGVRGHLWEQSRLPALARGRLLWSPSATGPLLYPRQVVTLHDTAFLDAPEFFSRSFVALYAALVPRLARRVAEVVTVSEFSRTRIVESMGVDPRRVRVIHNGLTDSFRPHAAEEIARTRAALDLPARYFLVQATADRRKNLARTLAAWRAVEGRLPRDLHLVVMGNMGRAHVFGAGGDTQIGGARMRALGFVAEEHVGPLMSGAEAFFFVSLYEGFGLPVIEAMGAGAPVVSANTTAIPEVAGDAALLVDPLSEGAIASAMLELAQNGGLRAELVAKGFRNAARFRWDEAAAQYARLFESLAAPQARAA